METGWLPFLTRFRAQDVAAVLDECAAAISHRAHAVHTSAATRERVCAWIRSLSQGGVPAEVSSAVSALVGGAETPVSVTAVATSVEAFCERVDPAGDE